MLEGQPKATSLDHAGAAEAARAEGAAEATDDPWAVARLCLEGCPHPERRMLGRPHPDRAAQFKPFAALKGLEELLAEQERLHAQER